MPSTYLQPGEYAAYGAPSGTTVAQVSQASVLIDAYLKRPEGLVWSADSAGNPGWMSALTPRLSLTAPGAIAAGSNVVVPVTGGIQAVAIGDALVLDRSNNGASEIVVVGGMTTSPATVTLVSVVNNHSPGVHLDQGMTIKQHLFMPKDRPVKNLAYTPVVRLLSGQGRYGYGRRGDSSRYMVDEINLLASLTAFGGPPAWEFFPLQNTGIDPETGQIWVPAGVMLAYYSEVNIWYVAGFAQGNIPDAIKSFRAGDTQIQMFAATLLSDDTKRQIDVYRANLFA